MKPGGSPRPNWPSYEIRDVEGLPTMIGRVASLVTQRIVEDGPAFAIRPRSFRTA